MSDADARIGALRAYARSEFAHSLDAPVVETPRGWRRPPSSDGQRLRAACLSFGFCVFLALLMGVFVDVAHGEMVLKARGVDTSAVVVSKWRDRTKSGYSYLVGYRFTPAGKSCRVGGFGHTTEAEWDSVTDGSAIPVTYDPQDPKLHEIDFDRVIHTRDPLGRLAPAGLGFSALFAVFAAIGVAAIRRRGEPDVGPPLDA